MMKKITVLILVLWLVSFANAADYGQSLMINSNGTVRVQAVASSNFWDIVLNTIASNAPPPDVWSNISGGIVYPLSVALGGATNIPVPGVNLAVGADNVGSNGVIYFAGSRAMVGYKGTEGAVLQAGPAKTLDLIVNSSTFGTGGYYALSVATNGNVRIGAKASVSQTNLFSVVGGSIGAPTFNVGTGGVVFADGTQTRVYAPSQAEWSTTYQDITNGTTNVYFAISTNALAVRFDYKWNCNANVSRYYLWTRFNGDAGTNYFATYDNAGYDVQGNHGKLDQQSRLSFVSAAGTTATATNRVSTGWIYIPNPQTAGSNLSFQTSVTQPADSPTFYDTTLCNQHWFKPVTQLLSYVNFQIPGTGTSLVSGRITKQELLLK